MAENESKATEAALAEEELPEGVTLGEPAPSLPPVKQLVRWLSRGTGGVIPGGVTQVSSVEEVDYELGVWYNQGYKLFNTHYLGEAPEAYGVMYVLVKA